MLIGEKPSPLVARKLTYMSTATNSILNRKDLRLALPVLLEALSIPLSVFQVAGGTVLFVFAMTMIFGESKPESELSTVRDSGAVSDLAIFPLAVPSSASPGAMMAVILLTDNHRFNTMEQALTISIMSIVLGITLVFSLLAGPIQKAIGGSGASIVSRVMGLILASVAADSILTGIKVYFSS